MKFKALQIIFLSLFLHTLYCASPELPETNQDIQLYYAYSSNKTYSSLVEVVHRDFYIITRSPLNESQVDSVFIHHEQNFDINWGNIPANYEYTIIKDNINITLWSAHLKWMSLGSPFKYRNSFAITCKKGNTSFWDNNQLHNYNLMINDGYFLGAGLNIKVNSINATCRPSNEFIFLFGYILVRNVSFRKAINTYYKYNETDFKEDKATFFESQNNLGIEIWKFQHLIKGIKQCPEKVIMKFQYVVNNNTYVDDNFGMNYIEEVKIKS